MTTTEVENYPGFVDGIQGPELMAVMQKQAERFGAEYKSGLVSGTDFSGRPLKVKLDGGEEIETKCVIIATGSSARYLGLDSEQALIGKGVSSCATCDGAFFRDVPVAVIGGGDSAMEEAIFLTRFASKVYVIHRRDELRASKIMGDRARANEKIEFVWDAVVTEVHGVEENRVTGCRVKNVKTGEMFNIDLEGFFLAIGHHPNTEIVRGQVNLDDSGYIVTARGGRTNIDGVFAAGDVQDPNYRQAVSAAGSGCIAALEAERYLEGLEDA
jgi:thioredoxin reductase (NADPH)